MKQTKLAQFSFRTLLAAAALVATGSSASAAPVTIDASMVASGRSLYYLTGDTYNPTFNLVGVTGGGRQLHL